MLKNLRRCRILIQVEDISGSLLDALNSNTENENSDDNEEIFEIDDLLSEIDETNSLKAQPQAVVSEDIIAQSKDDGTAGLTRRFGIS